MIKVRELHRKNDLVKYSIRETILNPNHIIKIQPTILDKDILPEGLNGNAPTSLVLMIGSNHSIVLESVEQLQLKCSLKGNKELLCD